MSKKKVDPMEQAMQDALESVERREAQARGDVVEVEAEDGAAVEGGEATASDREAELKEQLLRMAADFENYRKRTRKELEDTRKFATDRVIGDMLPVLDNLQRALEHASPDDAVAQGVTMVSKQFLDVFGGYGVKPFDSVGLPFDPERHEAMSQMPSDEHPAGVVAVEMQKGYMQQERLLRPAKVVVSSGQSEEG